MNSCVRITLLLIAVFIISGRAHCQVRSSCIPNPDFLDGVKVVKLADIMPEYPGGQRQMLVDIKSQFKYPEEQQQVQQKVDLTFVVDTLGHIRNVCIHHPFSPGSITPVEESMVKIMGSMNNWTAGKSKGKKIPVRIMQPIIIEPKEDR